MPHVVITGGAGFIYSHVTRYFVARGWTVTVADHFDMQGKGRNLAEILDRMQILVGDLCLGALAQRIAALHADFVVHAAAYTHVDDAIADPARFALNNVVGTTNLLQALAQEAHRPQKIVVTSTDEVFGPTPPGMAFDERAPYNPSNAYAASKVGVEAICRAFVVTHQLPLVVVRPCNTYAPRQFPNKVIPKFVRQCLQGEPLTVYNDGNGSRDWLHAEDHARAIEVLLTHGRPGESYNLAAGEEHSDREIAEGVQTILGVDVPLVYVPGRPGHDRRYAMTAHALRWLGWRPQVPFAEGFRDTVLWNAAHQDWWADDCVRIAHGQLTAV